MTPEGRRLPKTGRRLGAVALAAFFASAAPPVSAAPPPTIDGDVQALMQASGAPGLALGVVEHGRTVLAKGWGVRQLGRPEPVDAETLFQIGSTTKAFTAAALALLKEEGRLNWDDHVIDHLPEFQMFDPWVTREFTIRDLLTHRSGLGLGAGDLTFWPRTTFTRPEIVRAIRWLKPVTSFRSTFAYDNLLYIVAGEVIEKTSGSSWEDFVRARLLLPLGMTASTTDEPSRFKNPNRAQGHGRLGPPALGFGPQTVVSEADEIGPNANPAGGIMSSAQDMSRWVAAQLAHGRTQDGKRLWSETSAHDMWAPVTPLPLPEPSGPYADAMPRFRDYALGWQVEDYHGRRIVWHAGGTAGFLTLVVLLPEEDIGFVIMQNSMDGEVLNALERRLLDHYLGLPASDWGERLRAARARTAQTALAALGRTQAHRSKAPPSAPLEAYVGDYLDRWYGPMRITAHDGGLEIDFRRTPGMTAHLVPYGGDSFAAAFTKKTIDPVLVNFTFESAGRVSHVLMRPLSPLADFSFDYQDLDFTPATTQ